MQFKRFLGDKGQNPRHHVGVEAIDDVEEAVAVGHGISVIVGQIHQALAPPPPSL
jgi:hypothetical protein